MDNQWLAVSELFCYDKICHFMNDLGLLESFILNYPQWSYLILFAGMFIDGEAFFLTAIIFSLQGFLNWIPVIAIVFVGVLIFDVVWYYIGKYSKGTRLGLWAAKKFTNYEGWLHKNFLPRYAKMAFYSKFIYYVNRITPLLAGWHNLEFKRFLKIHFYADVFWMFIMIVVGYLLGFAVELVGAQWVLRRMEFVFIGLIVVFVAAEYVFKRIFNKKIRKNSESSASSDN